MKPLHAALVLGGAWVATVALLIALWPGVPLDPAPWVATLWFALAAWEVKEAWGHDMAGAGGPLHRGLAAGFVALALLYLSAPAGGTLPHTLLLVGVFAAWAVATVGLYRSLTRRGDEEWA